MLALIAAAAATYAADAISFHAAMLATPFSLSSHCHYAISHATTS